MIPWLGFERRWRDRLGAAALPGYEAVDTDTFWRRFAETAPPMLRRGLRLAVWVLTLSPPLLLGRARTFGGLTPAERDVCLVRCVEHRSRPVRDLAGVLRLTVAMAYFADPGTRARAGAGGAG